ncbi:hypothetical protein PHJA_002778400 [Phtheirospermum japonicum]|uniref:FLZ-type domain-containing protein n=1 Tax=Phtheirospermum japonicum TaxID=374723 RepID=A0A830DEE0_9LAMI|nr:hypothetical protein PHJA_002778400 [Phtheirospermum japonicum]
MMLGKRARPPMKRTTSMTEFTLDLNTAADGVYQPSDPHNPFNGLDQRSLAAASPRLHRRNSADLSQTANFLRACSLCKRRLTPGRDIYMYRGDSAFCSLECRQRKMAEDERKEKCSSAPNMEAAKAAAGNQVSAAGGTIAAL